MQNMRLITISFTIFTVPAAFFHLFLLLLLFLTPCPVGPPRPAPLAPRHPAPPPPSMKQTTLKGKSFY